jgi:single-stranded-DNA-specific exonuclease
MELNSIHTTTEKFVWKIKNIFASSEDNLYCYFKEKKDRLFFNIDHKQNTSLLEQLPKPWSMKDIRKAADRIFLAIEKKQKIAIFGDYDVDGTTSCGMLSEFFLELNYPVSIYIPDRLTEGYGLNPIGVQALADAGIELIITVDNGIAAVLGCQEAIKYGIDVIITDHHDLPSLLPNAFAILNPKQIDCSFPFKMLAGVGVAFYLMVALRAVFREKSKQQLDINLKNYLDYVAI